MKSDDMKSNDMQSNDMKNNKILKSSETQKPTKAALVAKARGIKYMDISRIIGLHPSTVSRIFCGHLLPNALQARQISECLGVSAEWVFDQQTREKPNGKREEP